MTFVCCVTQATGYPAVSISDGFKYDPNIDIAGGSNDWMYSDRGIYAYCTELWHLFKASGVFGDDRMAPHSDVDHISYMKHTKEADLLKALHWCDDNLEPGTYFQDWAPFMHPQLGRVEIGGWRYKYTWQNPPPPLLEAEIAKNTEFALTLARALPRVAVAEAKATALGGGFSKVEVVLQNTGYLPTHGSSRALTTAAVRKQVKAELSLLGESEHEGAAEGEGDGGNGNGGRGLTLISGETRPLVRHLQGRARHTFDTLGTAV